MPLLQELCVWKHECLTVCEFDSRSQGTLQFTCSPLVLHRFLQVLGFEDGSKFSAGVSAGGCVSLRPRDEQETLRSRGGGLRACEF